MMLFSGMSWQTFVNCVLGPGCKSMFEEMSKRMYYILLIVDILSMHSAYRTAKASVNLLFRDRRAEPISDYTTLFKVD